MKIVHPKIEYPISVSLMFYHKALYPRLFHNNNYNRQESFVTAFEVLK